MRRAGISLLGIIVLFVVSACSDAPLDGALMIMGDSISTEGYYAGKLRSLLRPSAYYNTAVSGAWWGDKYGTGYDGEPQFNGGDGNRNNVLGNQVQYVINNRASFNPAPDVILIAAGINDGNFSTADCNDAEIESFFTDNGRKIELSEPTFGDRDTYMGYRLKITGAMRSAITRLQGVFPNAKIFVCTPIECCRELAGYDVIYAKQQLITKTAHRVGVNVIPLGEECGISGAGERLNANGRHLIDGLHPNSVGSWRMADYLARFIREHYSK